MNIYRAGEIRRDRIVKPVIISEPTLLIGDGNELTGPRMELVKNKGDARLCSYDLSRPRNQGVIVNVNMGNLMVGYGKDLTRPAIDHLESELIFNCNPPLLAKDSVQVNRAIHFGDPVLRYDRNLDVA